MFLRRLISSLFETPSESVTVNPSNSMNTFTDPRLISLSWLYKFAPCFPIKSDRVTIITEPKVFYDTILLKCKTAVRRITLASLYLGTGNLEQNFISTIANNTNLIKGHLKVNILLDFTRGSRGKINSRTLLLPLLQKYDHSVNLSLYHTPRLRGVYKKFLPQRWNELIGLQHMKLYIFDDTLIISGANLSNDYFTNRQDRYFMIEDRNLADFYSELVSRVQEFSLKVDHQNNLGLSDEWKLLPYSGDYNEFVDAANQRVTSLFRDTIVKQNNKLFHSEGDTWIFPLVEMGQLNIRNDSLVTKEFISRSLPNSKICLSTGYFNLTKEYMNTIIETCLASCQVIMAHPDANGFQGARFPAGGIPAAYSLLAHNFQLKYQSTNSVNSNKLQLYEYLKPGWTYHAKGLWYYLPNSNRPILTFIGSPNFGERSVQRDLETQIIIVTTNENLSKQLNDECNGLCSQTIEAEVDKRQVPYWVHPAVFLFRNFF